MSERVVLRAMCDRREAPHVVAKIVAGPGGYEIELRTYIGTRAGPTWRWERYPVDSDAATGTVGRCPCGREYSVDFSDLARRAREGERTVVLWPAHAFGVDDQLAVVDRRAGRVVRGDDAPAL